MYKDIERKQARNKKEIIDLEPHNAVLFIRNLPCDSFYIILSGKVTVCSGNEGFMTNMGPFSFLGVDALLSEQYKPDFSAKVINQAKLLKITRHSYMKAISNIKNFQR